LLFGEGHRSEWPTWVKRPSPDMRQRRRPEEAWRRSRCRRQRRIVRLIPRPGPCPASPRSQAGQPAEAEAERGQGRPARRRPVGAAGGGIRHGGLLQHDNAGWRPQLDLQGLLFQLESLDHLLDVAQVLAENVQLDLPLAQLGESFVETLDLLLEYL